MNPDDSVLIENYLLGKLSAAEARSVEQRAEADPAFARELQKQRDIFAGIELYGEEKIKAVIAGVDKTLESGGFFNGARPAPGWYARIFRYRHWIAIAAIALLCLGVGIWRVARRPLPPGRSPVAVRPDPAPQVETAPLSAPTEPKPARRLPEAAPPPAYLALVRAEWTPPDFSSLRAATADGRTLLARATSAFQRQDYVAVVRMLAPVGPADPNYWPVSEMYAHACFLGGETERAADRFRRIADSGQLPFSERAEWHLLLCRLATWPRGKPEFEALLKKILADEGHPYFDKARALRARVPDALRK